MVAQALEISSIATMSVSVPVPVPPYASSNGSARMSFSRKSSTMSCGNSAVASISAARGAMRSRVICRTSSRISRWSSLRSSQGTGGA